MSTSFTTGPLPIDLWPTATEHHRPTSRSGDGALDATLQLSFPGTAGRRDRRTDRFRVEQASLAGEGGSWPKCRSCS